MAPTTGPALIILVAFVLPGFVTVLFQERTFKSAEDATPFDRLLRTLYYSLWCYLLLALAAILFGVDRRYVEDLYDHHDGDPAQLIWRGTLAVLLPALIVAETTRRWEGSRVQRKAREIWRINGRHAVPSGWDHFFAQGRSAYVRVTMNDGSRVHGYYGPASFAAYSKDGGDLFLEQVWVPDEQGWFGTAVPGALGVWIRAGDAVAVEVYSEEHASDERNPETT